MLLCGAVKNCAETAIECGRHERHIRRPDGITRVIHASTLKARSRGLFRKFKRLILPRRAKKPAGPVDVTRPRMTDREIDRYTALLAGARTVIEYGTGGSTLLALGAGVSRLISVETDLGWIGMLRDVPAVAEAERQGRLTFVHVDIGRVGKWGKPVDDSGAARYAAFASAPWSRCDAPDVVFIDGRFRVACALETLLRSGGSTRLAFHDFWKRPQYHVVLPFVDCIDRVDSLAVFKRQASFNENAATQLLERYRTVQD